MRFIRFNSPASDCDKSTVARVLISRIVLNHSYKSYDTYITHLVNGNNKFTHILNEMTKTAFVTVARY